MSGISRRLPVISAFMLLVFGALVATSAQGAPQRSLALQKTAGFSIDYYAGYKLVTVKTPWPGAGASAGFSYLLYPRGQKAPAATVFPQARRVETPVRRVITFSTSYLPAIAAIGESASIVGVDSAAWVYDPAVRAGAAAGKIAEVAPAGMPVLEKLVALAPDAIFTYGMGNEWDSHPQLLAAGLPVIIDGEWNESDPLARAEWAVFIAAFYDKEDRAAANFATVLKDYQALAARARAATSAKPAVLNNGPFQGIWYVSAGESYMAKLLADAGGRYLWADSKGTGGLSLTVEAVYDRALAADLWLNPAAGMKSVRDVIALDKRFEKLPVVQKGAIWNNDKRSTPTGGNDYFEAAVLRPDQVLGDLIGIFHPELLPGRESVYFRKLDR